MICVRETRENEAELILGNFAGWSPEHPHLYGVSIEAGEDRIESYFGMRKFGIGKDEKGITRLLLNGKPYFQNGVLDQGYWPESFYTPPSDEAMVYDIKTAKRLGFNMIRKHLKVECARWYSHCDHIGMLVWQDMINGGGRSIQTFLLYLPTVLPFVTTEFRDNCYPSPPPFRGPQKREESGGSGSAARRFISFTMHRACRSGFCSTRDGDSLMPGR